MITACVTGFVAGLIHVFAGPDHLAALAPLSLHARSSAWRVGLRWGLGHTAGVLLVAALAFSFRQILHLEALSTWGERLVGASLIILGLWGLRGLYRKRLHIHSHQHSQAASEHIHFHVHNPDDAHESVEFAPHVHTHTAFWVGTLHGFAGTAHLVGILPSLALPSGRETAGYLCAFALGTLLAMTGFAAAIGRLTPQRGERGMRGYAYALAGTSGLCLLTGLAWIILPLAGVELP